MAGVSLRRIVKRFGVNEVVHGIDLDIEHDEFIVLVGPAIIQVVHTFQNQ